MVGTLELGEDKGCRFSGCVPLSRHCTHSYCNLRDSYISVSEVYIVCKIFVGSEYKWGRVAGSSVKGVAGGTGRGASRVGKGRMGTGPTERSSGDVDVHPLCSVPLILFLTWSLLTRSLAAFIAVPPSPSLLGIPSSRANGVVNIARSLCNKFHTLFFEDPWMLFLC